MFNNIFEKAHLGDNHVMMYVAGFLVTLLGYFIGQLPLGIVMLYLIKVNDIGTEVLNDVMRNYNFELIGMDRNLSLFLLIMMFVFALITLYLWVKGVHKKNFLHLISPSATIDWNRIFWSFGVWFSLGLFSEAVAYFLSPADYVVQFVGPKYLILVFIALVFLPIQTSFEEIFIRGYIMQGLSNVFKNKILVMALSTVVFACMHGMNPEIGEYGFGIMMTYYFLAGFFLALIAVQDGRLELALGVHAGTNIYGALITSYEGSVLQTDTILKFAKIDPYSMVVGFVLGATIFYVIAARKYNWPPLSNLLQPIPSAEKQIFFEDQIS